MVDKKLKDEELSEISGGHVLMPENELLDKVDTARMPRSRVSELLVPFNKFFIPTNKKTIKPNILTKKNTCV